MLKILTLEDSLSIRGLPGYSIDLKNVGASVEEGSPYNNVDFTPLGKSLLRVCLPRLFLDLTCFNSTPILTSIDITQPLPYASSSFDVIHIRNLSAHIPQYLQLIERCARILRQGGLLVVSELEHFYVSGRCGYRGGDGR